jgi:hypothetical protein
MKASRSAAWWFIEVLLYPLIPAQAAIQSLALGPASAATSGRLIQFSNSLAFFLLPLPTKLGFTRVWWGERVPGPRESVRPHPARCARHPLPTGEGELANAPPASFLPAEAAPVSFFLLPKNEGSGAPGRRTQIPRCETRHAPCDRCVSPPGAPPRFYGAGPRSPRTGAFLPAAASSSRSGHSARRSESGAARARGYESRPRAPHPAPPTRRP